MDITATTNIPIRTNFSTCIWTIIHNRLWVGHVKYRRATLINKTVKQNEKSCRGVHIRVFVMCMYIRMYIIAFFFSRLMYVCMYVYIVFWGSSLLDDFVCEEVLRSFTQSKAELDSWKVLFAVRRFSVPLSRLRILFRCPLLKMYRLQSSGESISLVALTVYFLSVFRCINTEAWKFLICLYYCPYVYMYRYQSWLSFYV